VEIRFLGGRWYSTEELANMLGVDSSTIRRWRTAVPIQGPPFVHLSERVVLYHADDIERWLLSRRTDPSEAA
jgi:predicted DNA-binding transcriptional regulator AlpA